MENYNLYMFLKATLINHTEEYRIWYIDGNDNEQTITYIPHYELPALIDNCVYTEYHGIKWEGFQLFGKHEMIIPFNREYKKELARDMIAKLVCLSTGFDYFSALDIVNETITAFVDHEDSYERRKILSEYLDIGSTYSWIFKERNDK